MLLESGPEWRRYVQLRVVRNLSGLIHRWFNVEVTFVGADGYVRAYGPDRVFEPANPICRALLGHRDGFKRCMASSAEAFVAATRALAGSSSDDGPAPEPVEHTCHMGFRMLTVPIEVDGRVVGAVIASGMVPEGSRDVLREKLVERGAKLGVQEDLADQVTQLPVVDHERIVLFAELLAEIVEEIETYHRELTDREEAIRRLKEELSGRYAFGAIVGKSKVMRDVFALIEKVAASDSTVLVQGENGTGKELIARALHYNSPRKDKAFVVTSGAGFNENLLESELFGHVRGAFTGAVKDKKGLFEVADGGTFFLDEIGEMSPTLQVKLLRVLQEGTFMPVGSTEPRKVDVRLVCATNRDLKRMVERGDFREDLYYRINVIHVTVPPLRERREDLPLLADHFIARFTAERGKPVKRLHEEVMQRFFDYDWPGNVRELENEIERLVVLAGDEELVVSDHLSARIRERSMRANVKGVRVQKTLPEILEEVEKRVLLEGLRRTRWNKSQLAKELGISRKGLIAKVARYRLDRRRDRG